MIKTQITCPIKKSLIGNYSKDKWRDLKENNHVERCFIYNFSRCKKDL